MPITTDLLRGCDVVGSVMFFKDPKYLACTNSRIQSTSRVMKAAITGTMIAAGEN